MSTSQLSGDLDGRGHLRLEGFHALKHALRFGAQLHSVHCSDLSELEELASRLAPDVREQLMAMGQSMSQQQLEAIAGRRVHTSVIAVADAPRWTLGDLTPSPAHPLVVLDDPRDAGNVGACVRVAAAVGACGVLVLSGRSPFEVGALRGAAGLQYALPCVHLGDAVDLPPLGFSWRGLDAAGSVFEPFEHLAAPAFVFGSERSGLRPAVRASCHGFSSLPMATGVSSLNLATSVAATTYLWRYGNSRGNSIG